MANYSLSQTGGSNIQTTFRYELAIGVDSANTALGLTEAVTCYITKSDLPSAPGDPIAWFLPGGMRNWQAGKRLTKEVSMEFVVPTDAGNGSIYRLLEKWANATYNLNKGTNVGKAKYCTDSLYIKLRGEDDQVRYTFNMVRAQVKECNYGTVNSEENALIKVSATFVYDQYRLWKGDCQTLLIGEAS